MERYLAAMGMILVLLTGWVAVQALARAVARRHPQFGAAREEGAGCGGECRCSGSGCRRKENE